MSIDDAISRIRVASRLCPCAHHKVFMIPRTHLREELFLAEAVIKPAPTSNLRPFHWPQSGESIMGRVCKLFPFIFVWIICTITFVLTPVMLDSVYMLAASEDSPSMCTLTTINFIPAAAMRSNRLLDQARPYIRLVPWLATQ